MMYTTPPGWAPNERGTWNDMAGDGTIDVICETDRVQLILVQRLE